MTPSPKATVVVPTTGSRGSLWNALATLERQTVSPGVFEVVVCDNSVDGAIRAPIQELQSTLNITYIHVSEPGLHEARHAGARTASTELLLYIDDDVLVPPDWVKNILRAFAECPEAVVIAGRVLPEWQGKQPPSWLQDIGLTPLSILDLGDQRKRLDFPDIGFGCNLAIKRDAVFEVGGFNPDAMGDPSRVWMRGDGETGLQEKLHLAGYKVVYDPDAWLYHVIPPTRLTPDYVQWRFFIEGISDSYTRARRHQMKGLVTHALVCLLRCVFYFGLITFRTDRDARIRARVRVAYWWGRSRHQLKLLRLPKLRDHVLRESYL